MYETHVRLWQQPLKPHMGADTGIDRRYPHRPNALINVSARTDSFSIASSLIYIPVKVVCGNTPLMTPHANERLIKCWSEFFTRECFELQFAVYGSGVNVLDFKAISHRQTKTTVREKSLMNAA